MAKSLETLCKENDIIITLSTEEWVWTKGTEVKMGFLTPKKAMQDAVYTFGLRKHRRTKAQMQEARAAAAAQETPEAVAV